MDKGTTIPCFHPNSYTFCSNLTKITQSIPHYRSVTGAPAVYWTDSKAVCFILGNTPLAAYAA